MNFIFLSLGFIPLARVGGGRAGRQRVSHGGEGVRTGLSGKIQAAQLNLNFG